MVDTARLHVQAALSLLAAKRTVSTQPLSRLANAFVASGGARAITEEPHIVARLVFRLAAWMNVSCVPRAVALREMLALRGYDARVCMGIFTHHNRIFGHAWVAIGDAVIGEAPDLPRQFASLHPAALEGYSTQDGNRWSQGIPQESATFGPRW